MRDLSIDYTFLSQEYDEAKEFLPFTNKVWKDLIAKDVLPVETSFVLDVGGGTGRFSKIFCDDFGCDVIAIDPSFEMLKKIVLLNLCHLKSIKGKAEYLPLGSCLFNVVFMSSVVHHFFDIGKSFREAFRVLKKGGRLAVRFASHRQLYERLDYLFFPALKDIFEGRPDTNDIIREMQCAGFQDLDIIRVKELFINSKEDYLRKLKISHSSALTQISRNDFNEGIESAYRYFKENDLVDEEKYENMTLLIGKKYT